MKQERAITYYLSLAFGIPIICVIAMRYIPSYKSGAANLILYGIEGASPSIAVLLLWRLQQGREGLYQKLHSRYVKGLRIRDCMLGILIPITILTIAKGAYLLLHSEQQFLFPITPRKVMIIAWALVAEELGWRGYLQAELGRMVSRRWVPLLVGVIWGAWHFHFFLSGSMEVPLVPFFLGAIFESYGYYAITEQSGGNIVPASLWHFTGNLFFNLYRFDPSWHEGNLQAYWIVTAMYAVNLIYFHYSKRTSS